MNQLPDCEAYVVITLAKLKANQAFLRGIQ
jgi:hypothetical protein